MGSKAFAWKVLLIEALGLALLGAAAFFLVAEGEKPYVPPPPPPAAKPPARQSQSPQDFREDYEKQARSVADLASGIKSLGAIDLVTFVVDTSGSMQDDREDLRDSIQAVVRRNRGRQFEVINFAGIPVISGEPTRDLAEIRKRIDEGQDPGGDENSLLALRTAAERAQGKFKNPLIVLMTDAAPNDGNNSQSRVTVSEVVEALNSANARLYIWAAFDHQEYQTGGAAATSDLYRELADRVKAGGKVYLVKRGDFDPDWFDQTGK